MCPLPGFRWTCKHSQQQAGAPEPDVLITAYIIMIETINYKKEKKLSSYAI